MQNLYRENIMDHYKHPRNHGAIEHPDIHSRDSNPVCGDVLEIFIKLGKDNTMEDVRFDGRGCAISQAAASMLTEMIKGKKLEVAESMDKQAILNELGIDPGPSRIKCALLSLKVLKLGVYSHKGREIGEEVTSL